MFIFVLLLYICNCIQQLRFDPLVVDVENPAESHIFLASKDYYIQGELLHRQPRVLTRVGTEINGKTFGEVFDADGNPSFLHRNLYYHGLVEKSDGTFWSVATFSDRVGAIYVSQIIQYNETGLLQINDTWVLDSKDIHSNFLYPSKPSSGFATSWGSFLIAQKSPPDEKWFRSENLTSEIICSDSRLGSRWENYPHIVGNQSMVWYYQGQTCDSSKSVQNLTSEFKENSPSLYWTGLLLETKIKGPDDFELVPMFSMGRLSASRVSVMPDLKTVYIVEDGETQNLYKFVADEERDLGAGVLYGLQITSQESVVEDSIDKIKFNFEWINLGHADNERFTENNYDAVLNYQTSDFFEITNISNTGTCPNGYRTFLTSNFNPSNTECIKLRNDLGYTMKALASRLETPRWAAWKNVTSEFANVNGISFDSDLNDRIYISISSINGGLLDGNSMSSKSWDFGGENDIGMDEDANGCIFEMLLDENFAGYEMKTKFCGDKKSFSGVADVGYSDEHNAFTMSENFRSGSTNFAWLFDKSKQDTIPYLQGIMDSSISNGFTYKLGKWNYLVHTIHHPYKNNPDIPKNCDPLGENIECSPYTGTGCWTLYWYWPAIVHVEPEEKDSYDYEAQYAIVYVVTWCVIVVCFMACCFSYWWCCIKTSTSHGKYIQMHTMKKKKEET